MHRLIRPLLLLFFCALGAAGMAQTDLPPPPAVQAAMQLASSGFDSLFATLPTCDDSRRNTFEMQYIDGGFWPAGGASLLQCLRKPQMGLLHRLDSIANDTDRLWLHALATSVDAKPRKSGHRFQPLCKTEPLCDLNITELNDVFSCFNWQSSAGEELRPLQRKQVVHANRKALAAAYLAAPTRYVGCLQAARTPLGPGFALKVWTLGRFDPEWQWALSECTILLHYEAGRLDGVALHIAQIDGRYTEDFYAQTERLMVWQWVGEEGSCLEAEIRPSEGGEEAIDFAIQKGVLLPLEEVD